MPYRLERAGNVLRLRHSDRHAAIADLVFSYSGSEAQRKSAEAAVEALIDIANDAPRDLARSEAHNMALQFENDNLRDTVRSLNVRLGELVASANDLLSLSENDA